MAKLKYLIIFILLAVSLVLANSVGNLSCAKTLDHNQTIQINQANLFIQRAENEKDKQKGLGDKPCIGPSEAMLFVFDKPGSYSFWAKDMQFAIDIIWLSAAGKVRVRVECRPSQLLWFDRRQPAKFLTAQIRLPIIRGYLIHNQRTPCP